MPTEEEDKVITSVEDLDDEETKTSEEDESQPQEKKEEEEISEEDESQKEEDAKEEDGKDQPQKGQEDDSVEIEGVKYSKDDLSQIFDIGKKVSEYQKDHPGYDPILLHKDYTKKTQELAELKRTRQSQEEGKIEKKKEKPDLSKFRQEDITYFEQLASALGYAKSEEIEQREVKARIGHYESVKREEIKKFLDSHPEYKPENDSDDLRWNAIKAEFDLYKIPEDPKNFNQLLERAHRTISGTSQSTDSKKIADIIARKKAAASGQTSMGGGGGESKSTGVKSKKMEQLSKIAAEGGLSGYSKEEIEEMFS